MTIYTGTTGDDTISGSIGDDIIEGGDGFDMLLGNAGNDSLSGGSNNDILKGGDGTDVLDGGTGDDTLDGGLGSDTYLFGKGDGQDVVLAGPSNDNAFGKLNVLQLKQGITATDLTLTRPSASNDLVLAISNTKDSITIKDFFKSDDPSNTFNQLQQVNFSDGAILDLSTITAKAFTGTIGDDSISGSIGDDIVEGGDGFDMLAGNAGNDSLSGGANNDILKGGDGADTLEGGTGNDTLDGGLGSDTYLFGKGDGQDVVLAGTNNDNAFSKLNVLRLKQGITATDLTLTRPSASNDLVLAISNTKDSITIKDFFKSDDPSNAFNQLQQVNFSDGAIWDLSTITAKAFTGTIGDDSISGSIGDDIVEGGDGFDMLAGNAGNDSLSGGANNDILKGGDGADILNGGTGDDTIDGGLGSDTYLFGKGDGQDVLLAGASNDNAFSKLNVLQLKSGIAPSDVYLLRFGDDLQVAIISNTTDTFLVRGFFLGNSPSNAYNQLQQIKFADQTSWDLATVMAKATANNNPSLTNQIPDQKVAQDSTFNYQVPSNSFKDIDPGDRLTYTATLTSGAELPNWLSFNADTHTFSGTPTNAAVGTLNIKVTATDKGELSVSDTFSLTVSAINHTPTVANLIPDLNAKESGLFNFQIPANTFADPDPGDTLSYVASLDNGEALPSWLSFNASTRSFNGKPTGVAVGSLSIKVTATDKSNASASDTFALTVDAINHGPSGSNKSFTSVFDDTQQTFKITDFGFTDPDSGDQLRLVKVTSLPGIGSLTLDGEKIYAGQTINAVDIKAGLMTFTPTLGTKGLARFEFKVSDGDLFSVPSYHIDMNVIPVMVGTRSADLLKGGNGADAIKGLGGADILNGGDGNDSLDGGAGDDLMDGGAGADKMTGGTGSDTYLIDNTKDVVIEKSGGGFDSITSAVSFTLPNNVETLTLVNGAAKNGKGNALNNTLWGNTTGNNLDAGSGNDRIYSGAGDDYLIGGAGDDDLYGGLGNDTLNGGPGNDIYWFSLSESDGGKDIIKSFGDKEGNQDLIDLSSFGVGFEDLRLVSSGKNAVITIENIATADFQITLLGVKPDTLGFDDFLF
ncbi:MAG: putative Ig domain-containing protein [Methylococcales bacterium]|nr:putative Ig domain-containing protein [Methylococcales bacterium]